MSQARRQVVLGAVAGSVRQRTATAQPPLIGVEGFEGAGESGLGEEFAAISCRRALWCRAGVQA